MSRVYSVKSNARRDARKLGLDPDMVKAVSGGWVIDYPDTTIAPLVKPAKIEPAAKADKPPAVPRDGGDPKRERLVAMLVDWVPLTELMAAMGWQAHTVRGALSTAAKARGITIERQRVDGVTSYRVAK